LVAACITVAQAMVINVKDIEIPMLCPGRFIVGVTSCAGDLYVFRGKSGSLIKILWHDGIGMSLYAKRLERGRFIWPSTTTGVVSISTSQLA
jgi:transposase